MLNYSFTSERLWKDKPITTSDDIVTWGMYHVRADVCVVLQDAFSLLAYSDPWNSPVGYQLDAIQREPVCSTLNSAILGRSTTHFMQLCSLCSWKLWTKLVSGPWAFVVEAATGQQKRVSACLKGVSLSSSKVASTRNLFSVMKVGEELRFWGQITETSSLCQSNQFGNHGNYSWEMFICYDGS